MGNFLSRLNWNNWSLATRLVIGSSVAILFTAAIVLYGSLQTEIARARSVFEERNRTELTFLVRPLANQSATGNYAGLEQTVRMHAKREGIALFGWTDNTGRSIVEYGNDIKSTAPEWFTRWVDIPKSAHAQAITAGNVKYGTMSLEMTPTILINQLWSGLFGKLQILLLGIVIYFALTITILSNGLKSLHALANGAKRFGQGDYSVRIPTAGIPEVADSINAFNSMADNIADLVASLRQSEVRARLLASIVEQSSQAIITKDLNGIITSWNSAAMKLYGYAAEEAMGRQCSVLWPETEVELAHRFDCTQSGRPSSFETSRLTKTGHEIEIEISAAPLMDEHGRLAGEVVMAHDITERKHTQAVLFSEKERAHVTLESIGDGVITTDINGNVEYLNPVAEKLTGWQLSEAQGLPLQQIFRALDVDICDLAGLLMHKTMHEGRTQATDYTMLLCRDGQKCAIEHSAAPMRNRENEVVGVVLVFRDVSEARDLEHQLVWQSSHDEMTALYNRREFEQRLDALVEKARREKKHHALLYVDIDQFKIVNDTCGHIAGDALLRELAPLLQNALRSTDTIARIGGDEFGVLLEGCTLEKAENIAEMLRNTIAAYRFVWQDKAFSVTASIGLVAVTEISTDSVNVLGAADAACYAAKGKGRNRVQVYRTDDTELAQRLGEMQWVSRINRALDENRFRLYYQEILPIGQTVELGEHYELLIRMLDEDGSLVPPMAFIPAAERYDLMPAIDRWVITSAFSSYTRRYVGTGRKLHTASINLSGASLGDDDLLQFVKDQFILYSVPPGVICFEITETAAIANLNRAIKFIKELQILGCRFSLDDFGSGMSSFAYLKNLPVDYLKIDGSFIKDMETDQIDCAMVRAINDIAHKMNIQTIAEFVENQVILGMLKQLHIDYAQGFGIAKPKPVEELDIQVTPRTKVSMITSRKQA